jgi:hypothetical protein
MVMCPLGIGEPATGRQASRRMLEPNLAHLAAELHWCDD